MEALEIEEDEMPSTDFTSSWRKVAYDMEKEADEADMEESESEMEEEEEEESDSEDEMEPVYTQKASAAPRQRTRDSFWSSWDDMFADDTYFGMSSWAMPEYPTYNSWWGGGW